MDIDVAREAKLGSDCMGLPPFGEGFGVGDGLEEGGEGVVVGRDGGREHAGEEGEGVEGSVGLGVAAGEDVEEDGVRVGGLGKELVGVVHGGGGGGEGAGGDELGEEGEVVLETGFYE